jgi:hypothetical protein
MIYSQTKGEKEFKFKHWFALSVFVAFVALMIGVSTMETDISKMSITLSDKKLSISAKEAADIQAMWRIGSEIPGYDLMVSDGKGGLSLTNYQIDKFSIEGNDLYIREIVKRSPSGFFNFRNTRTVHYLVLPERVLPNK